jgi:tetratricopeptide (TPR) repeat protein
VRYLTGNVKIMNNQKDLEKLLRGISLGRYHLVLGAGASLGSLGGDQRLIPGAFKLAEELATDFGLLELIPEIKTKFETNHIDLKEIYEEIKDRRLLDTEKRSITEYFKYRFINCVPNLWQKLVYSLPWKMIWTLNIDDVLENAYLESSKNREITPISWYEKYKTTKLSGKLMDWEELQIIHLHGFAKHIKDELNIIFSIAEYTNAVSQKHFWHEMFADVFLQEPFIFVGANLVEEFDMAELLRKGSSSKELNGFESYIVRPNIGNLDNDRYIRWGLNPIKSTGEEFFNFLSDLFKENEYFPDRKNKVPDSIYRSFFSQFDELRIDETIYRTNKNHDFFLGDDPSWLDILNDNNAIFSGVEKALTTVIDKNTLNKNINIFGITGDDGSGKSTFLLRLGKSLIRNGFQVFLFKEERILDVESVSSWITLKKKTVLLFDGCADFSNGIQKLFEKLHGTSCESLIIFTEVQKRVHTVLMDISSFDSRSENLFTISNMRTNDTNKLLDKLTEKRRVGQLTNMIRSDQLKFMKNECEGHLLEFMFNIEGAVKLRDRLKQGPLTNLNELQIRILKFSSIVYSFGLKLPISLLSKLLSIRVDSIITEVENSNGYIQFSGSYVKGRNKTISRILIEEMSMEERYQYSMNLSKVLFSYVDRYQVSLRTIYHRISREIFDASFIFHWIGKSKARDWYHENALFWDWNARFWEQRALLEIKIGNYPQAYSYAEHAVKIYKDSFSLNTLGSILMKMSFIYYDVLTKESLDSLRKGIDYLRDSRNEKILLAERPYSTFFTNLLSYAEKCYNLGHTHLPEGYHTEWNSWIKSAKNSPLYENYEFSKQLNEFENRMLSVFLPEA